MTFRVCLIALLAMSELLARQAGGFLRGVVRGRSGAPVAGAEVQIQSEDSGARQHVFCDAAGEYVSSELAAGTYKITVRERAFRTATQTGVRVAPGEIRTADFSIELLPLQQEITVESRRDESDPAENGLVVTRQSSASALPANGRDLHAFYNIVPGSTVTPASSGDGGQFTVNGQRPNTNTVRVDGINGNTGLGVSSTPGTYPGSTLPGMTVIGSTQDLTSKDEIERVELRSSDFAPEYGDRPGAQILIETRSGSNDLHAVAFGYGRPSWLDSQDWFAQEYGVPLAPASLSGYGADLGGAVVPDKMFFFLSFERLNLNDTALQLLPVPSLAARAATRNLNGLILNAFPAPIGPNLNALEAVGAEPLEKQASVKNYGTRLDYSLGKMGHLFARYSYVPSRSETQQLSNTDAGFRWVSATLGATTQWGAAIHDFRANFTRVIDTSDWRTTSVSEETALTTLSNLLPPAISVTAGGQDLNLGVSADRITALSIPGIGQIVSGTAERTYQNQWEGSYVYTLQDRGHDFRAGADYIRLLPRTEFAANLWTSSILSTGVETLLAGDPLGVTISYGKPNIVSGQIVIGSVFAQDTFKLSERLNLLYGIRWEITPPSHTQSSTGLFAAGAWSDRTLTFQPAAAFGALNESDWPMRFDQIAPRIALVYRFKKPDIIFRAGAGVFYDDALGSLLYAVNLSPLTMWQYSPPPKGAGQFQVGTFQQPPPLALPRIWEWRTSLEKSFEGRTTVSLAYAGSAGRRLFNLYGSADPQSGVLEHTIFASWGTSDYNALQAQFTGKVTSNLDTIISYSWSHSIDTGSQGSAVLLEAPGGSLLNNRGSSSFDVRHNLNASFSYRIPTLIAAGPVRRWLSNWNLSSTFQARTGFPLDVSSADQSLGLGFANTGRPDLVPGIPIWIQSGSVPGGRKLNPSAFIPVSDLTNGTLGRNVLTGPGLFQIDANLRRQFPVFRRSSLEMNLSAFNLLNHANFSNPVTYIGSPLFGQSTSMQSLMLGSGTPTGGITPIFQSGGPRTVEFGLKLLF